MAGARPRLCAAIVNNDLAAIDGVTSQVDLFEVRIDLIGSGWREIAGRLKKPWIACNRRLEEGGKWRGSEPDRVKELLGAVELGAGIIDIELGTPGVEKVIKEIKSRAECLLSCHNLKETPPLQEMKDIINRQFSAGADICKMVATANSLADNLAVLQLIKDFPQKKVIAFAMGSAGQLSRILCPLVGGYLSYVSIEKGSESAAGQITAEEMREIYKLLKG